MRHTTTQHQLKSMPYRWLITCKDDLKNKWNCRTSNSNKFSRTYTWTLQHTKLIHFFIVWFYSSHTMKKTVINALEVVWRCILNNSQRSRPFRLIESTSDASPREAQVGRETTQTGVNYSSWVNWPAKITITVYTS